MMQAFIAPLAELAEYQEILQKRRKEKGILQIAGCVNSQKTHLMYALGDGFSYKIIVFSSEEKAQKAYEEYRFLDSGVLSGKRFVVLPCGYQRKLSDEAADGSDPQYGDKTKESGDYSDHDYGCFSGRAFSGRGNRFEADSDLIRRYC